MLFGCSEPSIVECNCNDLLLDDSGSWQLNNENYTGICRTYFSDSIIESESQFDNGKINGHLISYYPNGVIEEDSEWKNGKRTGTTLNYYESSEISIKTTGVSENKGKMTGYINYFYKSGVLSEEGQVIDDSKEGVWKVYHENGKLMSYENWKNNAMIDSSFGYFSNGNLKMKGFWVDGIQEGKWMFYDSISGEFDGYLIYLNGIPQFDQSKTLNDNK